MVPDTRSVLTKGARVVVETLIALGFVAMLAIEGYRAVVPSEAKAQTPSEIAALRQELRDTRGAVDAMSIKLDAFNTRLSWLEGATSGALKQPVRTSGVGQ